MKSFGSCFAYLIGMDTVITVIISAVLVLGAVVTMSQAGYTFDLRRKGKRHLGGRRHDDLNGAGFQK
jgi:hypothetical protein